MTIVDEVFTRDGIVVATGYLNIDVPGYLDDIIDSLWGEQ
jgi:lysine/ornithine N-monooxygenase